MGGIASSILGNSVDVDVQIFDTQTTCKVTVKEDTTVKKIQKEIFKIIQNSDVLSQHLHIDGAEYIDLYIENEKIPSNVPPFYLIRPNITIHTELNLLFYFNSPSMAFSLVFNNKDTILDMKMKVSEELSLNNESFQLMISRANVLQDDQYPVNLLKTRLILIQINEILPENISVQLKIAQEEAVHVNFVRNTTFQDIKKYVFENQKIPQDKLFLTYQSNEYDDDTKLEQIFYEDTQIIYINRSDIRYHYLFQYNESIIQTDLAYDATIYDAKQLLSIQVNALEENIGLFFAGYELKNMQLMSKLHIPKNGCIEVIAENLESSLIQNVPYSQRSRQYSFRTLDNEIHVCEFRNNQTIADAKFKFSNDFNASMDQVILFFGDRVLQDSSLLIDIGAIFDSIIEVVIVDQRLSILAMTLSRKTITQLALFDQAQDDSQYDQIEREFLREATELLYANISTEKILKIREICPENMSELEAMIYLMACNKNFDRFSAIML